MILGLLLKEIGWITTGWIQDMDVSMWLFEVRPGSLLLWIQEQLTWKCQGRRCVSRVALEVTGQEIRDHAGFCSLQESGRSENCVGEVKYRGILDSMREASGGVRSYR